jgi:glycosyltransferase involved in cell wall biosynthesis
MDPYRILFFISSLRGGGAENHLLNLCRYLQSVGHDTAVCTISPCEDGLESQMLVEDITIIRLPLPSLADLLSPMKIATLRGMVRQFDPDLLHAHLFHGEAVAWVSSHFVDVPLVATRHSTGLEFGGWRRLLVRLMNRRLAGLIAVSREAALEAGRMGYGGAISVIPNAVDTRRFRPLSEERYIEQRGILLEQYFPGASERTPVIGAVGGLKPVKNFSMLVRLAARFAGEGPHGVAPRFVLFGEGTDREHLVSLSWELSAQDFIAFPGHRERPEEIYPLFDLFVLPSRSEGVPMALLEAMASGVACVASDVGDVGEIVGDTGTIVASGNEEGFAEAIRTLLDDPSRRSELGRKARVRVMERYDTDAWGDTILNMYRSLLEPR